MLFNSIKKVLIKKISEKLKGKGKVIIIKEYKENQKLRITIVVVKQKNNNKKYLILGIVLLVLLSIFLYVFFIHNKMKDIKNNYEEIAIEENVTSEEQKEKIKLPILTQQGRDNIANIYSSEQKTAYITFDDGPSAKVTPQILSILDQYQIKATFFVLGRNVDKYPEIVKQEYEKGHYIANHGYTHEYTKVYANPQALLDEFNRTQQSVRNAIGVQEYSGHLFRFPGGSMGTRYRTVKDEAIQLLSHNDILYIDWNALTNDSVGKPTAESIVNDLKSTVGTKNSVVILMHDTGSKQLTVDTLPQILDYLIEQGYTFKTFYDVIV